MTTLELEDLPSDATVLTVRAPTQANLSGWLKGLFDQPPYSVIPVDYPANLKSNSIVEGVGQVDRMIRATQGPIILVGHSQGAQVLTEWILAHNDDASAPTNLTFILTGNPVRNPTGQLVDWFVTGGGVGRPTPLKSRWPIIDVARKGDTWAIRAGNWFTGWWGKLTVHPFYKGVDLFSPSNMVDQVGNTTFVVTP